MRLLRYFIVVVVASIFFGISSGRIAAQTFSPSLNNSPTENSPRAAVIVPLETPASVSPLAEIVLDTKRSMTLRDVRSMPTLFSPVKSPIIHFGFTGAAVWMRFWVQNPYGIRSYLQVFNAPLDTLEVMIPRSDGTVFTKRYGAALRRDVAMSSTYPVLALEELDTALTMPREIYVRVVSNGVMYLPIEIAGEQAIMRSSLTYSWFNAASFTVLAVMVLYNFFVYLTVRQRSYLFYVLYGLAISLFFAYQKGYVVLLLGNSIAEWMYAKPFMPDILVLLPTLLICLFTISFLRTFEILPRLHRVLLGLIAVFAILILVESLSGWTLARKALSFMVMVSSVVNLSCGIAAWRQGYRPALFYLIGWGIWLVATIVYAMYVERILPISRFIELVLQLGAVSEAVLMSFALGDRINLLQQNLVEERHKRTLSERERELEHIRNTELEKANAQIQAQSDKITDYNLSIEAANTELQQINEQLTQQQRLLERRSREIEVMNGQLQRQNTQLYSLNEEKNEFLGIAAHDLKNPLTGLRGMLEILSGDDELPKEYRQRMVAVMRQSVDRMFEIVSKFLDVNALEQGAIIPSAETLAIMPLVQSVVGNYALPAADKHIRISVSGNERAECFSDKQLTLQVLDNLVSNAVKYSPLGSSVRITVTMGTAPELCEQELGEHHEEIAQNADKYTFITVEDKGPGLTEEDRKNLFRKFARLSAKPTGGEHSTGLGLSIAKRLVEAMRGEILCVSEQDKGSAFVLVLPTKESQKA
ncbi:MAG: ATP-binding protein [Candidatus Kapabacteria bacterium]|nr:ATP-binding protein [Candidatus Kapabacteria bacterium]